MNAKQELTDLDAAQEWLLTDPGRARKTRFIALLFNRLEAYGRVEPHDVLEVVKHLQRGEEQEEDL
jgi:hypothetical protein